MEEVKVYMIANLQIHDADRYREYEKGFFPILKKHCGEFITYDDNIVNVEGEIPMEGRIILFSFPSFLYSSTKIVRSFTTFMNFFSEISFGKKSIFESLIYNLPRF